MLHERNNEVAEYFAEDRDAVFFGSLDEAVSKITSYLHDNTARERIAAEGRHRSIESDYSIDARMKHVVSWIESARARGQA